MQQVAVRGMDLEDLEAGGMRAAYRFAVGVQHHLEVALLEGARRDPVRAQGRFGRRHRAPRLVAALEIGVRERAVAVPRARHARLAPGVCELNGRSRPVPFQKRTYFL